MSNNLKKFSEASWLSENPFGVLAEVSHLLHTDERSGREALIRTLEHRSLFQNYEPVQTALIQKSGLYPYLEGTESFNTSDLINLEVHSPEGMEKTFLHRKQFQVYRTLLEGTNVILSAPTSFGKSLLIDAAIASNLYANVVVIVPTIALIDETRRRLTHRFQDSFKIVTHPSQDYDARNLFIFTQERFLEAENLPHIDFFVLDEFYKLSPKRGDDRTFTLNHAFYNLLQGGSQFFLIGPNVQEIRIEQDELSFKFFKSDYTTVATDIVHSEGLDQVKETIEVCKSVSDSTLIFCKSANSAYDLAQKMIDARIYTTNRDCDEFGLWLANNFHPDWTPAKIVGSGIAVHCGTLPRSVSYQILRKFNEGKIRFLLCTSTIIEGVNTAAKNIIIYDNKIALQKFDQFTFNNIKGRAGRLLQHCVGRVYLMNPEPDPELPIVEVPAINQPNDTPESLLIQMDPSDLSERSQEQLRYLHAQDYLPIEVIRANQGVEPEIQIAIASLIAGDTKFYQQRLGWTGIPDWEQKTFFFDFIFEHLVSKRIEPIGSSKQLKFTCDKLQKSESISQFIYDEATNNFHDSATKGIEFSLKFIRNWCDFHLPRFIATLHRIQESVFTDYNLKPGNYLVYSSQIKHLFRFPAVTLLEEYGLPGSLTEKLEVHFSADLGVDEIVNVVKQLNLNNLELNSFESELLKDVQANL